MCRSWFGSEQHSSECTDSRAAAASARKIGVLASSLLIWIPQRGASTCPAFEMGGGPDPFAARFARATGLEAGGLRQGRCPQGLGERGIRSQRPFFYPRTSGYGDDEGSARWKFAFLAQARPSQSLAVARPVAAAAVGCVPALSTKSSHTFIDPHTHGQKTFRPNSLSPSVYFYCPCRITIGGKGFERRCSYVARREPACG